MKTYLELNDEQQVKAVELATSRLLQAIIEGSIRFNDGLNGDTLQDRIDSAFQAAEEMQTPWFAGEYVMDKAGDEIRGMAQCDAEDSIYPESGEFCVPGVA